MRVEDSAPRSDDRVGRSDVVAGLSAVAVVGGATYLGLTTKANVAAILAFATAVFVALLTAFWTQRRLDHELRAEQKRLELRLKHDRAQADLLDLRVVLEEALAAIDEAFHPMRVLWQNGVDETDDVDHAMRRVSAQLDRLHIRLDTTIQLSKRTPRWETRDSECDVSRTNDLTQRHTVRRP